MSDNLKKQIFDKLSAFIDKHKAAFADVPAGTPPAPLPAAKPNEYTLQDGTKVSIDKLELGGIVTMADGSICPAGELTLADGTSLTIVENGVIGEIETPEVVSQEPTMEEMKKACGQFAVGTPEERIARLELVCKALMQSSFGWEMRQAEEQALRSQAIAAYSQFSEMVKESKETFSAKDEGIEALKSQIEKQDGIIKEMFSVLSQISNLAPIEQPINHFAERPNKMVKEFFTQIKQS
jgi:hypothetical protein